MMATSDRKNKVRIFNLVNYNGMQWPNLVAKYSLLEMKIQ